MSGPARCACGAEITSDALFCSTACASARDFERAVSGVSLFARRLIDLKVGDRVRVVRVAQGADDPETVGRYGVVASVDPLRVRLMGDRTHLPFQREELERL